MKWKGTLAHVDVGTGAWVLTTASGEKLGLYGDVPSDLDGRDVTVEGEELDGMGIGMVGDKMVQVRSVRPS